MPSARREQQNNDFFSIRIKRAFMNMRDEIIPSNQLISDMVPNENAPMKEILDFARTFDVREINEDHSVLSKPDLNSINLSLAELRAFLYMKQRALNHLMRRPNKDEEKDIRKSVKLIREIL